MENSKGAGGVGDTSLHYGDLVYLQIENIGAYVQSSG